MSQELRVRNPSQQLYVTALSAAWHKPWLDDPSLWHLREPELEEKMLRDSDIAHAVGFRQHLIAGKDWTLMPSIESERAPMATMVGSFLIGAIRHFTEARLNLARAFFSGARFGRIYGSPKSLTLGDGQPRTWWVPSRIEDLDKRSYRIVPVRDESGELVSAYWERWNIGAARWETETVGQSWRTIRHVYQDDQGTFGYGRGLRESLAWWWYAKTHVMQEALGASEKHGQGALILKIDGLRDASSGLPNEELMNKCLDVLENMRARHSLVVDKNDDIQPIESSGTGWQLLENLWDRLTSSIFTRVLGANLTTSADKGGSYALAEVQENSTEALIQFDRETLQETLTDDLIGCVWKMNHANLVELGIADQPPQFAITQEKIQDPVQRSQVAQILNGMGVELALDDVLEQTGFRKPESGETIIPKAATPSPVPSLNPGSQLSLPFAR